jgi:FixJ family two-component response regulator
MTNLAALPALAHVIAEEGVQRLLTAWLEPAGIQIRTYTHLGDFLKHSREEFRAGLPCCLVIDAQPTAICGIESQAILLPLVVRCPIVIVEKPLCEHRLVTTVAAAFSEARRQQDAQTRLESICERYATLTPRERQVMSLVVSGLMNKQVGSDLGVSEITVKAHRGSVTRKMRARSLPELVRMADAIADRPTKEVRVVRSARSIPIRSVAAADLHMG